MSLQLPDLDDRTYADLVSEARALIPSYAPSWTDHNPSDPGITLIELFAYLTEMLTYRLNRVTDANKLVFLKLLRGPTWEPERNLNEEIRAAVLEFRDENRCVTCEDFERLALAADPEVARTRCLPRRNLASENPLASSADKPGHVSVVIIPAPDGSEGNPKPSAELIKKVKDYLEPRRLLTTQVHVIGPRYFTVGVQLKVILKPDALEDATRSRAIGALQKFLHPLLGGPDGAGWPFGRDVYVSEIYQLLDTLAGVDYVEKKNELDELIIDDPSRLIYGEVNAKQQLAGVALNADELVAARIDPRDIDIVMPDRT